VIVLCSFNSVTRFSIVANDSILSVAHFKKTPGGIAANRRRISRKNGQKRLEKVSLMFGVFGRPRRMLLEGLKQVQNASFGRAKPAPENCVADFA
jgi:hypothetical protein